MPLIKTSSTDTGPVKAAIATPTIHRVSNGFSWGTPREYDYSIPGTTKDVVVSRKTSYKKSYSSHFGYHTRPGGSLYYISMPFKHYTADYEVSPGVATRRVLKEEKSYYRNYPDRLRYWQNTLLSTTVVDGTGIQQPLYANEESYKPGLSFPGARKAAWSVNKKIGKIDLNVLVAYAERRSTYRLISDNTTKVSTAIDHLNQNDLRGAAESLGAELDRKRHSRFTRGLGPKWLELIYGWQPLLSDIHGALIAHQSLKPASYWVKSSIKTNESKTVGNISSDIETLVTYKALMTVTNPIESAAQKLGLTNPALLAWELVPYSFVFDWFLPVGGYLESLDRMSGQTMSQESSTYTLNEYTVRRGETPIPSGWKPGHTFSKASDTTTETTTTVTVGESTASVKVRRKDRNLDFPDMPLPSLRSPLSLNNAITSVALLEGKRPFFNKA